MQRRPFLKRHRLEIAPFLGVAVNDLFVRHYALGADANYFVAETLSLGVEAQAFRRQRNRRSYILENTYQLNPSLNRHLYAAAVSAAIVLLHGKLVTLNRWITYWELSARAGIGLMRVDSSAAEAAGSARNAGTLHAGLGLRFFASRWLTINAGLRDYVFRDVREGRYHQVVVQLGAGVFFPFGFSYRADR